MTKARLGNRDIFASTTSEKSTASGKDGAPAPAGGSSVDNKITVILPPDQVNFLDEVALAIRRNTGAKIRRTEIIRALVAGLMASKLSLTGCGTEEDITAVITKGLK